MITMKIFSAFLLTCLVQADLMSSPTDIRSYFSCKIVLVCLLLPMPEMTKILSLITIFHVMLKWNVLKFPKLMLFGTMKKVHKNLEP